jgi:hypothetical protein
MIARCHSQASRDHGIRQLYFDHAIPERIDQLGESRLGIVRRALPYGSLDEREEWREGR